MKWILWFGYAHEEQVKYITTSICQWLLSNIELSPTRHQIVFKLVVAQYNDWLAMRVLVRLWRVWGVCVECMELPPIIKIS